MRALFPFVVTLVIASPAAAQILSPGPLAMPHAELEGLSNCTKCHELGKKVDGALCLACHTALKPALDRAQSFHGAARARGESCVGCHRDHRGRQGALSEWGGPREKLDHRRTGYALTGKHAKARCDACHAAGAVTDGELRKRLKKRKLATYLGLSPRCLHCHADEHRGQLGADCGRCHDTDAFAPTQRFEHGKSYPLRGAHARIECVGCHPVKPAAAPAAVLLPPKRADIAALYKPVPKRCAGCHRDVHGGKFGKRCERCHGETSWTATHIRKGDIRFHQKTKFPLEGKHQTAACELCHPRVRGKMKTTGIPFAACTDCHFDAHFSQMPPDESGAVPCQRCHDTHGFFPPRYPLAEHRKGPYPLAGAHLAVACNRCHVPDPDRFLPKLPAKLRAQDVPFKRTELYNLTRIRMPEKNLKACSSCHRDPHGGQFQRGDPARACTTCHRVEGFKTLAFDHARHTTYRLTGKHAKVPCAACHWASAAEKPVVYRGTSRACSACHVGPHLRQFRGRPCADCHAVDGFKPARYDHVDPASTAFPLDGKHLKVKCDACHPKVELQPGVTAVWYRGVPKRCDGCHRDVHAGSTTRRSP